MSDKELARLEVLRDPDSPRLTAAAAARLLGVSRRPTPRLLKALRTCGVEGLISKQRGRPSNRRKPDDIRAVALASTRPRRPRPRSASGSRSPTTPTGGW